MQKFKTLYDAVALAEFAHRNQLDKAAHPYINHPRRVLQGVQAQGGAPYVQIAAILHDVTEDTAFTPQMLQDLGIPLASVEIVRLMDRHESHKLYEVIGGQNGKAVDESKFSDAGRFVATHTAEEFYYWHLRTNPGAVQVKLADIGDNMLPWRLSYLPADEQTRLRSKYTLAVKLLTE